MTKSRPAPSILQYRASRRALLPGSGCSEVAGGQATREVLTVPQPSFPHARATGTRSRSRTRLVARFDEPITSSTVQHCHPRVLRTHWPQHASLGTAMLVYSLGMAIAQSLCAHSPRERSGSIAANRFDYQLDWALCRILELHAADDDYVVVIDYHDDVLILDSASDPSTLSCFQIKSKSNGNWTRTQLLKRPSGSGGPLLSIVGKLFGHVVSLGDDVSRISFVSNAPIKMTDINGRKTTDAQALRFDSLSKDDMTAIAQALQSEHGLSSPPVDLSILDYERSGLVPHDHAKQAIGRLVEFLDAIPTTHCVPPTALYRAVKSELVRALGHEAPIGDFKTLCALKSITREKFTAMLADACAEPRRADFASLICDRLNTEHRPFQEVNQMRRSVRRFVIERLDPTDALLADDMTAVEAAIAVTEALPGLWETIEAVRQSLPKRLAARRPLEYVRSMIGVLIHEATGVPPVDPDAAEEEA